MIVAIGVIVVIGMTINTMGVLRDIVKNFFVFHSM